MAHYQEITNLKIIHNEKDCTLEINDLYNVWNYNVWNIKLYLRPLSSMTKEELPTNTILNISITEQTTLPSIKEIISILSQDEN